MRKCSFLLLMLICCSMLALAQQNTSQTEQDAPLKFALVIGNSAYNDLTPLANPVNDANDIARSLTSMGFSVETVLNGTLEQMEDAIIRLKDKLSAAKGAYGFFFYAGHGVQSSGENFLIPVNANIPSENNLRNRAVSVQALLDDLNDARNYLNVVVLDACRDNPFGWSRSGTRGLTIVEKQPADSIIVYATSAGARAQDGEGRNGLFTSQLLNHLAAPDLDVTEMFKRTGADVAEISRNQQIPAIYSQFFKTAYLAGTLSGEFPAQVYTPGSTRPVQMPLPSEPKKAGPGTEAPAKLWTLGASVGTHFADPWLIATVRGTIAPFNYSFFELGLDAGFISGRKEISFSYSLCPFIHYALFLPLGSTIGLYAGAGASYFMEQYEFADIGEPAVMVDFFMADVVAGVNLFSMLDISYTLRTNFSRAVSKLSVGYTYRFK